MAKRNLETAIRKGQDDFDVQVTWRPFLLRPDHPKEGVPKDRDTPSNPRVSEALKQAGHNVGIDFTGKTDRHPNTVFALALSMFALRKGGWELQNALQEVLFRNYFTDGLYPDVPNLIQAGVEVGLESGEVETYLTQNQQQITRTVLVEDANAKKSGVSGVPYYYFNDVDFGLSGSLDPDTYLQAFARC